MWLLGVEPGTCAKAVGVSNLWDLSLGPFISFKISDFLFNKKLKVKNVKEWFINFV